MPRAEKVKDTFLTFADRTFCDVSVGGRNDKSNVTLLWGGALRDETKTVARENMKKLEPLRGTYRGLVGYGIA